MCYYDVYHFACQDWEWGGLVSHCAAIGKPGQYCLGNLASSIISNSEECPCCKQLSVSRRKLDQLEQEWWNFSFIGGGSARHEKKIRAAKTELHDMEQEVNAMRFRKEGSRFAMLGSMQNLAKEHAARSKSGSAFATAPQVMQTVSVPPPVTVVAPPSPTSLSSTKSPGSMLSRSSTSTGSSRNELQLVSTWEDDDEPDKARRKTGWLRKRLREYADELKRDMSFDDD